MAMIPAWSGAIDDPAGPAMNVFAHNRKAWDIESRAGSRWCIPVDTATTARARFGRSLEEQIGGQMKAGFVLDALYEDRWNAEATLLDRFVTTLIATRAVKRAAADNGIRPS